MNDKLEFHPCANIVEMMEGQAWEDFKADIAEKGVLDPIMICDGMILDGRHRYKAATELGIDYRCEIYNGNDPLGWVISHKVKRQHLTTGQLGDMGANITNLKNGSNQHEKKVALSPDKAIKEQFAVTAQQAADMLGTSKTAVDRGKKLQREATPEVLKAVRDGSMKQDAALKTLKSKKEDIVGPTNVVPIGVEKKEPLTQKQEDIRRTKEYRQLKREYDTLLRCFNKLGNEYRLVITENMNLKDKIAKLTGDTRNVQ